MPQRYLVVGFPGLVARAVVRVLLQEHPQSPLEVLVETPGQAERLARWARQVGAPGLTIWQGRRDAVDLGLRGSDYMHLAGSVEHVVWCPDLARAEGPSLEDSPILRSAAELVEFALACRRLESAVYVSSILALGTTTGHVLETELHRGQRFTQRLEEACAVGEQLVERASKGVPLTIARAAPVLGDAEEEECALDGTLLRLVRACEAGPRVIPASFRHEPVHLQSADHVARALVRLVHQPAARGRRVHVVQEDVVTDAQFFQWVATACERTVEERPLQGLRPRPQSPLMRLDGVEARALQGWDVEWDTTEARALLPDLTGERLEQYLPRLVSWCRSLHD